MELQKPYPRVKSFSCCESAMAARMLQRHFSSYLFRLNQIQISSSNGVACPFFHSTGISVNRTLNVNKYFPVHVHTRGTQTLVDSAINTQHSEDHEPEPEPASGLVKMGDPNNEDAARKFRALSNLKPSKRHDLAMVFTCKVCETRSMKTLCRESYDKGVVVVRCGGCNNLHLIADHLGWFGEPGTIEELLAARGEEVKKGSVDSLNLTPDDLIGTKA